MPQEILPIIPQGATSINSLVSVHNSNDEWVYYLGINPIGMHHKEDKRSFSITIGQLIVSGNCRPCEIIKAFGVSKSKVMRAAKTYREKGIEGFF